MLPAGSKHSEWSTVVTRVSSQDLEKHKHKILGVISPRDLAQFRQLEAAREQASPNNTQVREEFDDCLLRSFCAEFLQIREYKLDANTQKRHLEVIRTCKPVATSEAAEGMQNFDNSHGLASNYFLLSDYRLPSNVL